MFSYPVAFDAPDWEVHVAIVPWRLVRKNENGFATGQLEIFEDTFIHFHMVHERDRHTDRQTDRHRMTA